MENLEDKYERLGVLIDEVENLACALNFSLPAQMHVEQLKISLPKKVEELKKVFIDITGENPWE